jgi:phosphoribosylformylglycinamidine (FGAM) synthase PurS component
VIYRIEIGRKPHIEDPQGASAAYQAREFLGIKINAIRTRSVYKFYFPEGQLDPQQL